MAKAKKAKTSKRPATGTNDAAREAAIATALDIASDDGVNLETAASYLQGANPEHFPTTDDARDALQAELDRRAK